MTLWVFSVPVDSDRLGTKIEIFVIFSVSAIHFHIGLCQIIQTKAAPMQFFDQFPITDL